MKTCSTCKIQKDPEGFNKDKSKKDGLHGKCKACKVIYSAEYREVNREKIRENRAKYYEDNREKHKEKAIKWAKENPEYFRAKNAKYREDNPEKCRANYAKWAKENPDKCRALKAKRKAAKLQRTPAWADLTAIKAIYTEAQRLQALDGVLRHVDHVIPLQGEAVSGFHIASNLQILTAHENISKSNRFDLTI